MFFENNSSDPIKALEHKIKLLQMRLQDQNKEIKKFFNDQKIDVQEVIKKLQDKSHFTEAEWEFIESERKKLSQKLEVQLKNVKNPKKTKEALESLNVGRHWLHVR